MTQHLDALGSGQAVRLERARLLECVRAGDVSMRDALDHAAAQTALAFQFIAAGRYSRTYPATTRERRVLQDFSAAKVPAYRLVSEMTAAEKDRVCERARRDLRGGPNGCRRRPLSKNGVTYAAPRRPRKPRDPDLPGEPLAAALGAYAIRTERRSRDAMVWAGVSDHTIGLWRRGDRVSTRVADRVLCHTDLLWWEVWPPEEFPEVAAIFEPEAVAA